MLKQKYDDFLVRQAEAEHRMRQMQEEKERQHQEKL